MSEQLATFTLCGHTYGVPVSRVQEVLKGQLSTPVPLAPDAVAGLMNLRGEVVLVIDLRARLSLPERGRRPGRDERRGAGRRRGDQPARRPDR